MTRRPSYVSSSQLIGVGKYLSLLPDLFDLGINPVYALSRLRPKSNVSGFAVQCERGVISFIAVPVPLQLLGCSILE